MSTAIYSSDAPRCLVTFTDVSASAVAITVYRTSDGRTEEVRGGVRLSAAAPFVMDYEVAVGTTSTYRAQQYAADGTELGYTESVSVTTPDEGAWLQQPLAPETAMRVRIAVQSGQVTERPSPAEVHWPEGATVGRLIGGQRRGIVGQSIRIYLDDPDDLAKVDAMFGGYTQDYPSVLLLRTPPRYRDFPRVYFMGVPSPQRFREGLYALSGFNFTATEVAAPYAGLVRALLRRMDIDAAYPTRAARAAAYATRLERDQDYSKAGLAG